MESPDEATPAVYTIDSLIFEPVNPLSTPTSSYTKLVNRAVPG
jgi:hypothetical protein